jgi:hypothetical protein
VHENKLNQNLMSLTILIISHVTSSKFESQLLLATEDPICLDPSPAVHLIVNRLQYENKVLDTPMIKR